MLNWRTLTSSNHPKFFVKGTELSVALFGKNSRFAVYETRTYIKSGEFDREYIVRDGEAVSDDDLRQGKRPPIVGRTDDYDKLLAFVAREGV